MYVHIISSGSYYIPLSITRNRFFYHCILILEFFVTLESIFSFLWTHIKYFLGALGGFFVFLLLVNGGIIRSIWYGLAHPAGGRLTLFEYQTFFRIYRVEASITIGVFLSEAAVNFLFRTHLSRTPTDHLLHSIIAPGQDLHQLRTDQAERLVEELEQAQVYEELTSSARRQTTRGRQAELRRN